MRFSTSGLFHYSVSSKPLSIPLGSFQIFWNHENIRSLKGHGNETDFLGFLQKLVPHESLTLPFEPFRFWLRIRGDIRIRKSTPRYHRCISVIRRVVHSPHQWYGELPTPRIVESESRGLRVSSIRRVDDSAYQWVGESTTPRIDDTGSRYSKKKIIWCWFSELLTAKQCL